MEEALWRPGLPGDNAVRRLRQALDATDDLKLRLQLMCALVRAHYDGRATPNTVDRYSSRPRPKPAGSATRYCWRTPCWPVCSPPNWPVNSRRRWPSV